LPCARAKALESSTGLSGKLDTPRGDVSYALVEGGHIGRPCALEFGVGGPYLGAKHRGLEVPDPLDVGVWAKDLVEALGADAVGLMYAPEHAAVFDLPDRRETLHKTCDQVAVRVVWERVDHA